MYLYFKYLHDITYIYIICKRSTSPFVVVVFVLFVLCMIHFWIEKQICKDLVWKYVVEVDKYRYLLVTFFNSLINFVSREKGEEKKYISKTLERGKFIEMNIKRR